MFGIDKNFLVWKFSNKLVLNLINYKLYNCCTKIPWTYKILKLNLTWFQHIFKNIWWLEGGGGWQWLRNIGNLLVKNRKGGLAMISFEYGRGEGVKNAKILIT